MPDDQPSGTTVEICGTLHRRDGLLVSRPGRGSSGGDSVADFLVDTKTLVPSTLVRK